MDKPTFDASEFDHECLEEAKERLQQAKKSMHQAEVSLRFAMSSIPVLIGLFLSICFMPNLGTNRYPIQAFILFRFGGCGRFTLSRRERLQDATYAEVQAREELRFAEAAEQESELVICSIRKVLLETWDPIGIKDEPNAQDEYDFYLGDLYKLLIGGARDWEIAKYLLWVAHDRMGFDEAQSRDMDETVRALKQIDLR